MGLIWIRITGGLTVLMCLTTQVLFENIECDRKFGGVVGEQGVQCKTCAAGFVFRKNLSEAGLEF